MARDPLEAHARDELGISDAATARPSQTALTSAASLAAGAAGSLSLVYLAPAARIGAYVIGGSLFFLLAALGVVRAKAGGAGLLRPVARVVVWRRLGDGDGDHDRHRQLVGASV